MRDTDVNLILMWSTIILNGVTTVTKLVSFFKNKFDFAIKQSNLTGDNIINQPIHNYQKQIVVHHQKNEPVYGTKKLSSSEENVIIVLLFFIALLTYGTLYTLLPFLLSLIIFFQNIQAFLKSKKMFWTNTAIDIMLIVFSLSALRISPELQTLLDQFPPFDISSFNKIMDWLSYPFIFAFDTVFHHPINLNAFSLVSRGLFFVFLIGSCVKKLSKQRHTQEQKCSVATVVFTIILLGILFVISNFDLFADHITNIEAIFNEWQRK